MDIFQQLFALSPTATIVSDESGTIRAVNDAALEKLSIVRDDVPDSVLDIFAASAAKVSADMSHAATSSGWYPSRAQISVGGLAGLHVHLRMRALRMGDPDDERLIIWDLRGEQAAASFREHTGLISRLNEELAAQHTLKAQLVQALDNEKYLHGELIHRVKNNLTLLSSMIHIRRAAVEDPQGRAILEEIEIRTRSIALVHELLDRNQTIEVVNAAELIQELCKLMRDSLVPANIEIVAEVESLRLHNEDATVLCLLINELVTNAVKHAFSPESGGKIELKFRRNGVEKMELNIRDDGRGIDAAARRADKPPTRGTRILGALAEQIRGDLQHSAKGGTEWTLIFDPKMAEGRAT